jgi:hypothetical protein
MGINEFDVEGNASRSRPGRALFQKVDTPCLFKVEKHSQLASFMEKQHLRDIHIGSKGYGT